MKKRKKKKNVFLKFKFRGFRCLTNFTFLSSTSSSSFLSFWPFVQLSRRIITMTTPHCFDKSDLPISSSFLSLSLFIFFLAFPVSFFTFSLFLAHFSFFCFFFFFLDRHCCRFLYFESIFYFSRNTTLYDSKFFYSGLLLFFWFVTIIIASQFPLLPSSLPHSLFPSFSSSGFIFSLVTLLGVLTMWRKKQISKLDRRRHRRRLLFEPERSNVTFSKKCKPRMLK